MVMHKINNVKARWILDSRGNPTVEVELITDSGFKGRAAVPSGASTGTHEALELRDKNPARFKGKGVQKALDHITAHVKPKIIGMEVTRWEEIDPLLLELDGTANKSKLGANAILAVSLAAARLASNVFNQPLYQTLKKPQKRYVLPVPLMNILNGGSHAGNDLAIQEFMVMPTGASNFNQGLRMVVEVYHTLKELLVKDYGKSAKNVGDEGGFAPAMGESPEAFEAIMKAIEEQGYRPGKDLKLAIDAAASEFFSDGKYTIDGKILSPSKLIDLYADLVEAYPLVSIEDPFHEDDFDSFHEITQMLGKSVQVVGDDLTVTNPERLQTAIDNRSITALLLKVNQIGSLNESIRVAETCFGNKLAVVVSHRSGETEDTTIADLAVAINSGQIKTGAPARTERTAKYNRLLRIEEELGKAAIYAGDRFRTPWAI